MSSDDIDALKAQLAAEQARSKELARFLYSMFNDLRGPVHIIDGYIGLIREDLNDSTLIDFIDAIDIQDRQLRRIIDDYTHLAHMDFQTAHPEYALTDLNLFVKTLITDFDSIDVDKLPELARGLTPWRRYISASVTEKHIMLEFLPDAESCAAQIDIARFATALEKILENAIFYSPDGGKITIRTRIQDGQVNISVQDWGAGIEASHLPHIFDRFYRANWGLSRKIGGHGLGLSIAKHAIEAHGGTITADSEPGRGTTFTIRLPLAVTD